MLRPEAERTPNRLGATLAELRTAMERAVLDSGEATGDGRLFLLPGRDLIGASQLADGVHPDDEGHAAMATAVARRPAHETCPRNRLIEVRQVG